MEEIDIEYWPDIKLQDFGRRPTTKNDIRALCQIIERTKGNVFEIGTWLGKTTYELATTFPNKNFTTIDWLDNELSEREQTARVTRNELCKYAKDLKNVEFIYMPSYEIDYSKYYNIKIVFIDGDHSYAGVKADTEKALEYLKPGSVIAWHDARNGTFGVPHYLKKEIEPKYNIKIFKGSQIAYIKI